MQITIFLTILYYIQTCWKPRYISLVRAVSFSPHHCHSLKDTEGL